MVPQMPDLTSYALADGIATITLDDGKVNALSPAMLGELAGRFDQAQEDDAVVVLTGRPRTFSAGFDLRCEPERWPEMLTAGARTAERLLAFPRPVLAACNGNAIAMGAFLLLAADVRIGAAGDFRIGLNEVAIGLTVPWFGIELARHRLTPPAFDRCTLTGVLLDPPDARAAGFLDRVVEPDELAAAALAGARELAGLDRAAHAATKLRVRERALAGVRDGIERIADPDREL
jgi:enoyl-CoA hydratase/carnithine racemase